VDSLKPTSGCFDVGETGRVVDRFPSLRDGLEVGFLSWTGGGGGGGGAGAFGGTCGRSSACCC